MRVKFFMGYGTQEKCVMENDMTSVPRVGERILREDPVREYHVEFVRWHVEQNWCRVQLEAI